MEKACEKITSRQNKYVSLACSLDSRKNREKLGLFRIDGIKLFCEAIKRGVRVSFVLLSDSDAPRILAEAERLYGICEGDIACRVLLLDRGLFEKISEEKAPEGIIAVCEYIADVHGEPTDKDDAYAQRLGNENLLLLESVRDPSNVGAVIRSAAAFGVDRIIMSSDCADIYSPKTLRAAMGALFGTKIDRVSSMPSVIQALRRQGREVYAATLRDESVRLGEANVPRGACVVIGNEGHGLSDATVSACSSSIYIPMGDGVESLNASAAASVLTWEFFGRRKRDE